MLLAVDKQNSEQDLPMLSRSGKSTKSQFQTLLSTQETKLKLNKIKEALPHTEVHPPSTSTSIDRQKQLELIRLEMSKIENEIQLQKQSSVIPLTLAEVFNSFSKKPPQPSSSFKSLSREKIQKIGNTSQSPEVGYYHPNFSYLQKQNTISSIKSDLYQNQIKERLKQRDHQQTRICLKAIKGFNYHVQHEKSQAKYLAECNKQTLEFEKAQLLQQSDEKVQIESEPYQNKSPLDLLNFYVKEMREPNYKDLKKSRSNKLDVKYKVSYLPNGKSVVLKSMEDSKSAIQKLFIVDWKRQCYPYNTEFEGEEYHLIMNRQNQTLQTQKNDANDNLNRKSLVLKFANQTNRKLDKTKPLNSNRFIQINKDPHASSRIHHVAQVDFSQQLGRPGTEQSTKSLRKLNQSNLLEYDPKPVLKRLNVGIPNFSKGISRSQSINNYATNQTPSTIDPYRVWSQVDSEQSKMSSNGPRFNLQTSRNDIMLRQSDRWKNNELDNTKEQRISNMKRKPCVAISQGK